MPMRLTVRHRTVYRYSEPIRYAIQTLRLEPRPYDGLTVLDWRVRGEGPLDLPRFVDGLGNVVHCRTIDHPHREATITAAGEVETRRDDGVVLGTVEPLPPLFFLRDTPLTAADRGIAALAGELDRSLNRIDLLHALMQRVRDRLDYRSGTTESSTSAAAALAQGHGVCQDHAHVFIAAARVLGIPARYVSGYLWTGGDGQPQDASHAWAEAFIPDLGWVGFDPANRQCPSDHYIRVATGLDYSMAAPVRGLRRGVAEESLRVEVEVRRPTPDQ
jgi:transglutaminase-like putative cysteine protease